MEGDCKKVRVGPTLIEGKLNCPVASSFWVVSSAKCMALVFQSIYHYTARPKITCKPTRITTS